MMCHMGSRYFRDINRVSDDVSAERHSRMSCDPVKPFLFKSSSDGVGAASTNIPTPFISLCVATFCSSLCRGQMTLP